MSAITAVFFLPIKALKKLLATASTYSERR